MTFMTFVFWKMRGVWVTGLKTAGIFTDGVTGREISTEGVTGLNFSDCMINYGEDFWDD